MLRLAFLAHCLVLVRALPLPPAGGAAAPSMPPSAGPSPAAPGYGMGGQMGYGGMGGQMGYGGMGGQMGYGGMGGQMGYGGMGGQMGYGGMGGQMGYGGMGGQMGYGGMGGQMGYGGGQMGYGGMGGGMGFGGGMGLMGGMGGMGGGLDLATLALLSNKDKDSGGEGLADKLNIGNLLGTHGGMALNALNSGDMSSLLMANIMGHADITDEAVEAAKAHGITNPDDMDEDGIPDHLRETQNKIDDYLAKQWLLGKRKLTVSVNYGNTPLEYQYLQQYHGMPNPLQGTPLGNQMGLNPETTRSGKSFNPYDVMGMQMAMGMGQQGMGQMGMGQPGMGQQSPFGMGMQMPQSPYGPSPYGPSQSPYGTPPMSPYPSPYGPPPPGQGPQFPYATPIQTPPSPPSSPVAPAPGGPTDGAAGSDGTPTQGAPQPPQPSPWFPPPPPQHGHFGHPAQPHGHFGFPPHPHSHYPEPPPPPQHGHFGQPAQPHGHFGFPAQPHHHYPGPPQLPPSFPMWKK